MPQKITLEIELTRELQEDALARAAELLAEDVHKFLTGHSDPRLAGNPWGYGRALITFVRQKP